VTTIDSGVLVMGGLPFTKRMALDAGLPRRHVESLIRWGIVGRVLRDVYVDARIPDDIPCRASAVALVLPPGAAIGRRTAAWLFGVDAWPDVAPQWGRAVECLVPVGVQPARRPGVDCFEANIPDEDLVMVGSVLATRPVRTAVDLLRWLQPHQGLGAADALAHEGLVEPEEIRESVERWRKHPGVGQARYLARLIEPATESFGESATRLRIVDAGLPRPVVQIEVLSEHGALVWRLDIGWPDRLKAVEYDGEKYHSTTAQREHDAARREQLDRRFGWQIYVARKEHVYGKDMSLEVAAGYMLGVQPRISRRTW